jgi:hypothetical protein
LIKVEKALEEIIKLLEEIKKATDPFAKKRVIRKTQGTSKIKRSVAKRAIKKSMKD